MYTCITGDYDNLIEIDKMEKNIDYLCFTNNPNIKSKTWKIIRINNEGLNNQLLSRKIKLLGDSIIDENYEVSMWMDASVNFNKSINEFIKQNFNLKKDCFAAIVHSSRNCIYEEAKECLRQRKDSKENIKKNIEFLKKEKYPKENGLYEMTVFIKKHNNPIVKTTMKLWFDMICKYSKRDQLSFMYCVWKTGMEIHPININVWNNSWFKCEHHNYNSNIDKYRVYFFDDNEFNIDNDFQGELKLYNDEYIIELITPIDTNKTLIELPKVPFLKMSNLKINNFKKLNIHYFNSINGTFFYNENGAFEIYNTFKKGDKIVIKFELHKSNITELINFYEQLNNTNNDLISKISICENKIAELTNEIDINKKENELLNTELKSIINSKSWKLIRKFDKIRFKKK